MKGKHTPNRQHPLNPRLWICEESREWKPLYHFPGHEFHLLDEALYTERGISKKRRR